MPEWNSLSDDERRAIIASVMTDDEWSGQIAVDVYNAIRRVLARR